jgi:hypothetical protein
MPLIEGFGEPTDRWKRRPLTSYPAVHIRADTVEGIVGQFITRWRNKVFQVVTLIQQGSPGILAFIKTQFRTILFHCLVGDRERAKRHFELQKIPIQCLDGTAPTENRPCLEPRAGFAPSE